MSIKVGDIFADNDPRMPGRVIQITYCAGSYFHAKCPMGRERAYSAKRLFTDGKQRKTGFTRVEAAP